MTSTGAVTQSQFAALKGWRKSYVTKLKKAGRLVLTDDGHVDVKASEAMIDATADGGRPDMKDRWDKHRAGERPPEIPRDDSRAYWERREAAARAELREIELAERKRDLIPVAEVRDTAAELGTVLRATLENLPDQLAAELAAITDEEKIRALLRDHIETALTQLADKLHEAKVAEAGA